MFGFGFAAASRLLAPCNATAPTMLDHINNLLFIVNLLVSLLK